MKRYVFLLGWLFLGFAPCAQAESPVEKNDRVAQDIKNWTSQSACEKGTGQKCDFVMCDYVPAGKTFEEVCGKGFHNGWQPMPGKGK